METTTCLRCLKQDQYCFLSAPAEKLGFNQMCAVCVLDLNTEAFCLECFAPYDHGEAPPTSVKCIFCPVKAHPDCAGKTDTTPYRCNRCRFDTRRSIGEIVASSADFGGSTAVICGSEIIYEKVKKNVDATTEEGAGLVEKARAVAEDQKQFYANVHEIVKEYNEE